LHIEAAQVNLQVSAVAENMPYQQPVGRAKRGGFRIPLGLPRQSCCAQTLLLQQRTRLQPIGDLQSGGEAQSLHDLLAHLLHQRLVVALKSANCQNRSAHLCQQGF
jgi:hypothetical protein